MTRKRNLLFNENVDSKGFLFDYFRISTLELMAMEIKRRKGEGSCAELGVYKGIFASKINEYFPDKTLYLLDTFEGFDANDLSNDKNKGYVKSDFGFSDTSIKIVTDKMPYPEKCKIVKGYFPESAKNIDDKFSFVSIDADLYNPTYEGLKYFYLRLSVGGAIFIHDYYNDERFRGVKEAVDKFCEENQLFFFPVSDSGGSVVIIKNQLPVYN